jgi:hypothetical protein
MWRHSNCGGELSYEMHDGKWLWWECSKCGESWHAKPPLGVMSRKLWDEQRANDLAAAIARYTTAGFRVPVEWIEEYNELVGRLT